MDNKIEMSASNKPDYCKENDKQNDEQDQVDEKAIIDSIATAYNNFRLSISKLSNKGGQRVITAYEIYSAAKSFNYTRNSVALVSKKLAEPYLLFIEYRTKYQEAVRHGIYDVSFDMFYSSMRNVHKTWPGPPEEPASTSTTSTTVSLDMGGLMQKYQPIPYTTNDSDS